MTQLTRWIYFIFIENSIQSEQNTFSSQVHIGTFSRIDLTLGHKVSLSKFRKVKNISSIFLDHNAMRLVINYRKKKKPVKTQTRGG